MPFGQVAQDDETPEYHPFLQAAAGMTPSVAAAAQPANAAPGQGAMTAPYYGVAAPQAAASQQAQAPSPQTAPVQGTSPAAPTVALPPPTAPDPHLDQFHALEAQLQKDSQPAQVKPHWYERLGGAAVGFGAGYKGGAAEGVREGSRVTNRGQIAADANREARVDADKAAMDNFQKEQQMQHGAYEDQVTGWNAQRSAANDARDQGNKDREFSYQQGRDKQDQSNKDREFSYRQGKDAQDQKNTDRDFDEKKREFGVNSSREAGTAAETARHDRAEEGLASQKLSVDQDKSAKDEKRSRMNDLVQRRDKEYDDANKEFDKQEAEAGSPEEKQAIQNRRSAKASELQARWNEEFSKADPNGEFRKQTGTAPQQGKPPAAPAQQQQGAPSTKAKDYAPLSEDKVGVIMNGKYVVGPRKNLQQAVARGAVEVK